MRVKVIDNRDPRWTDDDNAVIDQKVDEALGMFPRVRITGMPGGDFDEVERRILLYHAFREIARATSIDNVRCAPAVSLEAFTVVAYARRHNITAMLTQLLRVFMIAYCETATTEDATSLLTALEKLAGKALSIPGRPPAPGWQPLPDTDQSPTYYMQ